MFRQCDRSSVTARSDSANITTNTLPVYHPTQILASFKDSIRFSFPVYNFKFSIFNGELNIMHCQQFTINNRGTLKYVKFSRIFNENTEITRMHSSRMRTARLLTVSQHALQGGVPVRGCTYPGVYLPSRGCTFPGVPAQVLPLPL